MDTSATRGLLSTLPQELPLEFLKEITNAFSDERKISDGAFGTVYKVWFGVHFFYFFPNMQDSYVSLQQLTHLNTQPERTLEQTHHA